MSGFITKRQKNHKSYAKHMIYTWRREKQQVITFEAGKYNNKDQQAITVVFCTVWFSCKSGLNATLLEPFWHKYYLFEVHAYCIISSSTIQKWWPVYLKYLTKQAFFRIYDPFAKQFCYEVRGILDLKHRNALSNDHDALKATFRCSLIPKGSPHQVVLHVWFGVFGGFLSFLT